MNFYWVALYLFLSLNWEKNYIVKMWSYAAVVIISPYSIYYTGSDQYFFFIKLWNLFLWWCSKLKKPINMHYAIFLYYWLLFRISYTRTVLPMSLFTQRGITCKDVLGSTTICSGLQYLRIHKLRRLRT